MSDKVLLLSIDSHATSDRAGFREYIDRRHRDDFDAWMRDLDARGWPVGGHNVVRDIDAAVQWDDGARWEALESQGVAAEVVFPNAMPLHSFGVVMSDAPTELEEVGRQSYNRWLADFCARAPERRGGIMVTGVDLERSVQDVYWAKESGLRGVLLPPLGSSFFFEEKYDPFWAACCETGLVATQHGGVGLARNHPPGFASIMTIPIESEFHAGRCVWHMILGGVFERFPDLRLAVTEGHVDWMPGIVRWMDWLVTQSDWLIYADQLRRSRKFSRLPSEYFSQNCYAGGSFLSRAEVELRDDIGSDRLMFGTDFPHIESTYPNNRQFLQASFGGAGVTEEELRNILGRTAADLYGFGADALEPHVDRCGYTVEELLVDDVDIDENQPGLWHLGRPPRSPSILRPWQPSVPPS